MKTDADHPDHREIISHRDIYWSNLSPAPRYQYADDHIARQLRADAQVSAALAMLRPIVYQLH